MCGGRSPCHLPRDIVPLGISRIQRGICLRARARLPFSCIYVCMCAWGEWAKRARGRKKYRVSLFSGTLVGLTLFLRPRPGDVANFALFGHLIFFPPSGDLNSADRA